MSKYKEVREHVSYTLEEEKRVEEAKSKAMSKERRAITELFKSIQFEVEDVSDMEK